MSEDIYAQVAARVFPRPTAPVIVEILTAARDQDPLRLRAAVTPKIALCANGMPGYGLEDGQMDAPKNPCKNPPSKGHIFCPSCRREAGGL